MGTDGFGTVVTGRTAAARQGACGQGAVVLLHAGRRFGDTNIVQTGLGIGGIRGGWVVAAGAGNTGKGPPVGSGLAVMAAESEVAAAGEVGDLVITRPGAKSGPFPVVAVALLTKAAPSSAGPP